MKTIRLDIPYLQQPPNTAVCGAVCLQMVYAYYGVKESYKDIWPKVHDYAPETGRINCQTCLMGQHAQESGFKAIVVSCDKPLELIDACLSANIAPIVLCRTDPVDSYGHFCVVTGQKYNNILLHDPWPRASKVGHRLMPIKDFLPALRSGGEVSTGNTFLLVAPSDTPTATVPLHHEQLLEDGGTETCRMDCEVFRAILSYHPRILCLTHDRWFAAS